jgi:signal transduction histidine kinase
MGSMRLRPGWLVFLLTAFAAVAVGATGGLLLARYRAAALASATDRESLLVRSRAQLIGNEVAALVAEITRLSRLAEIDLADGTLEPEKRVLRIARRDTVLFAMSIAILDPEGTVLWSEPQGARPAAPGALLVGLARGQGRTALHFASGEIDVAAPIPGRGAIVGIVSGQAARALFGEALAGEVRDRGAVAVVLPGDSVREEVDVAREVRGVVPAGMARLDGTGQEWVRDAAGGRWLVTQAQVGDTPLILRLVLSAADVEGDLLAPFRRLVATVAVAVLLAILVGAAFGLAIRRLERAEVELDRSRHLAAMGKTSAAIAHEVKNGLNGLSVALDLLATGKGDPAALRQVHAQARAEIERLRDVAEDLTLFAATPRLARAPVDLAELCRDAAAAVADLAADSGVEVAVAAGAPVPAWGDAAKLLGAVTNLARNGVEAMGPGAFGERPGARRVARSRRLELEARVVDGAAVVEIRDDGPGLAPEVRARLFQPFVTTKRTGTGLGLAIASRVVTAHGGRIEALERPAGGTTFRVILPVEAA